MAIPAWLIAGGILSLKDLARDLFKPTPSANVPLTDFENTSINPTAADPPDPLPDVPKSFPTSPPVFVPPNKPYRDPFAWYPIEVKANPIEIPPRRLPKEADGQTAYKTPAGTSVSVKESVADRTFGKLLFNPLTNKKQKVRLAQDAEGERRIQQTSDKGFEAFNNWLRAQVFSEFALSKDYLENKQNFWDGSALILPSKLRGLQGDIGLLFGVEAIASLSGYLSGMALNAQVMGVRDTIPSGYKIVHYKPTQTRKVLTGEGNLLETVGDAQIAATLGTRDKFWAKEFVIEDWLHDAGSEQFKKSGGKQDEGTEDNPVKVNSLPDLLTHYCTSLFFRSGFHRYPAKLPKYLVKPKNEGLIPDGIFEEETESISDNLQFQEWLIKQLDAFFGEFPIKIKYKNEKGEETELVYENIAETLAEMVGLSLNTANDADAAVVIGLKNLVETAKVLCTTITAADYAKANAEYLGYKGNAKIRTIPLGFTPNAGTLEKTLEPSDGKTDGWECEDNDPLKEQIGKLLAITQIIKAASFFPWKPGERITGDRIRENNEKNKEEKDKKWEEFVKALNNPTGIFKQSGNPVPKIKDIATKQENSNG